VKLPKRSTKFILSRDISITGRISVDVHFEGYPGQQLYHCHVLEHEANDMRRPVEIVTERAS